MPVFCWRQGLNGVHFFGFDCGFGVWMVLFLDLGSHLCGGEHVYRLNALMSFNTLVSNW
jgi:hypothetical protein